MILRDLEMGPDGYLYVVSIGQGENIQNCSFLNYTSNIRSNNPFPRDIDAINDISTIQNGCF